MASVGPADLDPSIGRPSEHMIMPARHGGAAFPMSRSRMPRGYAPAPRDTRPAVDAHVRGAGMHGSRRRREVPIYDRATGRMIGFKIVDDDYNYSRGYGMGAASQEGRTAAPRARELDEYEAPAYARGAADFADDSMVDERYGRRAEPPARRERPQAQSRSNMRGGAAQDFADEEPAMSYERGGAAYDESDVDAILSNVKKTMMEQRRGRAAPEEAFEAEETAPAAGRRGRAQADDCHSIVTCVKGGCHTCLSRHPDGCECRSCSSTRYLGRSDAGDSGARPEVRPQKPRTTTRGPRPQDF